MIKIIKKSVCSVFFFFRNILFLIKTLIVIGKRRIFTPFVQWAKSGTKFVFLAVITAVIAVLVEQNFHLIFEKKPVKELPDLRFKICYPTEDNYLFAYIEKNSEFISLTHEYERFGNHLIYVSAKNISQKTIDKFRLSLVFFEYFHFDPEACRKDSADFVKEFCVENFYQDFEISTKIVGSSSSFFDFKDNEDKEKHTDQFTVLDLKPGDEVFFFYYVTHDPFVHYEYAYNDFSYAGEGIAPCEEGDLIKNNSAVSFHYYATGDAMKCADFSTPEKVYDFLLEGCDAQDNP